MSGHSKWHKVKHKKAATDSKKSKNFGRLSREIKIAARAGADPAHNAALREALLRAKKENLPQANIDRLLNDRSDAQAEVMYEGYGAGGVAVLVAAATDNTNRTVSELRALFKQHGGTLGEPGSVRWKFIETWTIEATVPATTDKDALELALIDGGATDIREKEAGLTVIGPKAKGRELETTLRNQGVSDVVSFASHTVPASQRLTLDSTQAEQLAPLLRDLEEHEDVIDVYTDAAVE